MHGVFYIIVLRGITRIIVLRGVIRRDAMLGVLHSVLHDVLHGVFHRETPSMAFLPKTLNTISCWTSLINVERFYNVSLICISTKSNKLKKWSGFKTWVYIVLLILFSLSTISFSWPLAELPWLVLTDF